MPNYTNKSLHGLLVIDKPLGLTSMDVVRKVRRAGQNCKTGHCGTLDPLATGVLICALGKATKAVSLVMSQTKVYEAEVDLSAFTPTDDAEGIRQEVEISTPPTHSQIEQSFAQFTGNITQTPPAFSAIKIKGKPAYHYARKGQEVEIKSRVVRIDEISLINYHWPRLSIQVKCGPGTYIRTLARQLGEHLETGGHLSALRRTASGSFTIKEACPLNSLPDPILQEHLLPAPNPTL